MIVAIIYSVNSYANNIIALPNVLPIAKQKAGKRIDTSRIRTYAAKRQQISNLPP
jgi:hypothetical protein